MVEAGGVAQADGVGRREQSKPGCGRSTGSVEQGQLAFDLQNTLDHEHHVGTAGVVLVEYQSRRPLQRPGQHAFAKLRHLRALAQDDRVLADQIDAADVTVQIDPDARPVEPRRDLLDVGRLAGSVIALNQHPPVMAKPAMIASVVS